MDHRIRTRAVSAPLTGRRIGERFACRRGRCSPEFPEHAPRRPRGTAFASEMAPIDSALPPTLAGVSHSRKEPLMSEQQTRVSRRRFLKQSVAAGAVLGAPLYVPATA